MYWTDKIKGAIMRSSLDGSSMYSLLAYGLISPGYLVDFRVV